jgi:hypothetical protein
MRVEGLHGGKFLFGAGLGQTAHASLQKREGTAILAPPVFLRRAVFVI